MHRVCLVSAHATAVRQLLIALLCAVASSMCCLLKATASPASESLLHCDCFVGQFVERQHLTGASAARLQVQSKPCKH